jgi:transposase
MIRRPPRPDRKQRALEEGGTGNPHARDVQDPAFVDSEFFDLRDLIQVKYEMLRRVRTEGQSVAKASAVFGVSRPTFYKAQSDFDRAGLVGLLPAKRGPRGPHKVTPEVARYIEQTVARGEELDPQRLAERVAERFGLVVHQRTVKRALARSKKKRGESRGYQPRWPCVGGTLRDLAARRHGSGRSPPHGAQLGTAHAPRDGGVDEERRGSAGSRYRYPSDREMHARRH